MAIVDCEKKYRIVTIRMNRPERLNAMGRELMVGLAKAWIEFRDDPDALVAILTGTGRCVLRGHGH